jgi:hypothetical protein
MSETSTTNEPMELERPQRGSAEPMAGRCGRKLRGTNPPRYCVKYPSDGRTACKYHGGASLAGVSSPSFKTGRHSKYMPKPLMERHEARLADIQAVKRLDEEIVMLDTRISDLCERLSTGERGTVWDDMQSSVGDFQEAFDAWRTSQQGEREAKAAALFGALESIKAIAAKGKETEQAWRDLDAAIHSKAKITAIEAKRMADMGEIATRDEVKLMVLRIVNVVKDHVTDPQTLRLISNDLVPVFGNPHAIGGLK